MGAAGAGAGAGGWGPSNGSLSGCLIGRSFVCHGLACRLFRCRLSGSLFVCRLIVGGGFICSSLADQTGAGLRVLNLGGGDVDTSTPMGGMVFTVMAALGQMELEIKRERISDSVSKRRAAGKDLGGRKAQLTDGQI